MGGSVGNNPTLAPFAGTLVPKAEEIVTIIIRCDVFIGIEFESHTNFPSLATPLTFKFFIYVILNGVQHAISFRVANVFIRIKKYICPETNISLGENMYFK